MSKKTPGGLSYLILIGFLERVSFWGVQAILLVYILQSLADGLQERMGIYAAFMTLNYVSPLIGGWFADGFIGNQKGIRFGLLMQSFGLFVLLYKHPLVIYMGLGAIVLGTGFLRVNVFSLLGKVYGKENVNIDAGFTAFYYLVSIAGVLAPVLVLKFSHIIDWNYACGFLGIMLLFAFFPLEKARKAFGYHGLEPSLNNHFTRYVSYKTVKRFFYMSGMILAPVFAYLIWHHDWIGTLLPLTYIFVLFFITYLSVVHKLYKVIGFYILILLFNAFFVSLFNQAASFIDLLTNHSNDTMLDVVLGRSVSMMLFESFSISQASEFFNLLNASILLVTGPLVIMVWQTLSRRKKHALPTVKFAIGFFFAALGFATLSQVYKIDFNIEGHMTFWSLLLSQFLLVAAELLIVPVALAQITRLVPYKYLGVLIGIWFLSLACAQRFGDLFLKWMHIAPLQGRQCTLSEVCVIFVTFGWWAFGFAVLALILSFAIRRRSSIVSK